MDYYEKPLVDRKPLLAILKKIEEMLPKKERDGIIKDFLRRKYSTFNNEIDEKVYAVIEKAFDKLKTAEIGYFDIESAEVKKRLLDIYYKSRKYTIGYCHLKNAIRKFRTSRIACAKIIDKNYAIPSDFNKNDY
ncbi:WYL domain-containing protein [Candidatus Pacearchaeota archaeon]|nr:WYL domain-containing protein [Candidatus Pacearchaeota archaeon]